MVSATQNNQPKAAETTFISQLQDFKAEIAPALARIVREITTPQQETPVKSASWAQNVGTMSRPSSIATQWAEAQENRTFSIKPNTARNTPSVSSPLNNPVLCTVLSFARMLDLATPPKTTITTNASRFSLRSRSNSPVSPQSDLTGFLKQAAGSRHIDGANTNELLFKDNSRRFTCVGAVHAEFATIGAELSRHPNPEVKKAAEKVQALTGDVALMDTLHTRVQSAEHSHVTEQASKLTR